MNPQTHKLMKRIWKCPEAELVEAFLRILKTNSEEYHYQPDSLIYPIPLTYSVLSACSVVYKKIKGMPDVDRRTWTDRKQSSRVP